MRCMDDVKSNVPKFRPDTVIDTPDVSGTFTNPVVEATAASNVKPRAAVPATAPIVTVNKPLVCSAEAQRQLIEVTEFHDAVTQTAWSTATDAVN